ncbi:MAG: septal ring-binding cell division protein DamX, partial [Gammaproteobacteria bacterium]
GVDKDIAIARSWYEKAAAQGTLEAENKLRELDAPPTPTESVAIETDARTNEISDVDVAAEYEISNIAVDGIKREAWVLSQAPEHYTLQIGSVTREDNIVKFIEQNGITNEAAYVQVVIKEVTRYNAIYGVYGNYAEANAAIESLPKGLLKIKPWVRSFRIVQQLLGQDDNN